MTDYNPIPHIHNSTSGKRYCEHCGQPLIEHTFKPSSIVGGEIKRVTLSTRGNFPTPFASDGVYAATVNIAAVGFSSSSPLTRQRDVEIGQLPKGSIRAHVNVRDVSYILVPNGSTATPAIIEAFLLYSDVQDKQHVIAPIAFTSFNAIQGASIWQDNLIVESPITDGGPVSLGKFTVETVALTLGGTITSIDVIIRANLSIQYEV